MLESSGRFKHTLVEPPEYMEIPVGWLVCGEHTSVDGSRVPGVVFQSCVEWLYLFVDWGALHHLPVMVGSSD